MQCQPTHVEEFFSCPKIGSHFEDCYRAKVQTETHHSRKHFELYNSTKDQQGSIPELCNSAKTTTVKFETVLIIWQVLHNSATGTTGSLWKWQRTNKVHHERLQALPGTRSRSNNQFFIRKLCEQRSTEPHTSDHSQLARVQALAAEVEFINNSLCSPATCFDPTGMQNPPKFESDG